MTIELSRTDGLSQSDTAAFEQHGFLICRGVVPEEYIHTMLAVTERDLRLHQGDIEYEADLQYPGAPVSREATGGRTARRLKNAICRDPVFVQFLKESFVTSRIGSLLGRQLVVPMAHHNCIMTKQPEYSSDTGWHQDIRYWSFQEDNLVNLWIALGTESRENGCLQLLPGSHRMEFERSRLDEAKFLRPDPPENAKLIQTAVHAELKPGDLLLFHARCFHAATRNYSGHPKYSVVFTFRNQSNPPGIGTRSASLPELLL